MGMFCRKEKNMFWNFFILFLGVLSALYAFPYGNWEFSQKNKKRWNHSVYDFHRWNCSCYYASFYIALINS